MGETQRHFKYTFRSDRDKQIWNQTDRFFTHAFPCLRKEGRKVGEMGAEENGKDGLPGTVRRGKGGFRKQRWMMMPSLELSPGFLKHWHITWSHFTLATSS